MNFKEADVIIIGGGIAGCSIAYRLAEKGRHVILLEKGRVGEEASGRAGGMVRQQHRHHSLPHGSNHNRATHQLDVFPERSPPDLWGSPVDPGELQTCC